MTHRQELRRLALVVRHLERVSTAGREWLAARLLDTTQADLHRRGLRAR